MTATCREGRDGHDASGGTGMTVTREGATMTGACEGEAR